jgi:hypothetical protein
MTGTASHFKLIAATIPRRSNMYLRKVIFYTQVLYFHAHQWQITDHKITKQQNNCV